MPRQPITAQEVYVPLEFPSGGIDQLTAYESQRPGTCATALNVRGFDPSGMRNRGGSRPGLAQYIAQQVNGSSSIQEINSFVSGGTLDALFTTDFTGYVLTFSAAGGQPWNLYEASRLVGPGGTSGDTPQSMNNDGTAFYVVTQSASSARTARVQRVTVGGASSWAVTLAQNTDAFFASSGAVFPPPQISTNVYVDSPGVGISRLNAGTGAAVSHNPWLVTTVLVGLMGGNYAWEEAGGVYGTVLVGTTLAMGMVKLVAGTYTYGLAIIPLGTTTVTVQDRMSTVAGDDLYGRTADSGQVWTGTIPGILFIRDARARCGPTGNDGDAFVVDTTHASGTASLRVSFGSSTDPHDIGMVFRVNTNILANGFTDGFYACVNANNNTFRLYDVTAGVFSVLDSIAFTPSLTADYCITVVTNGTALTASITGGSRALTAVTASHAANTFWGVALSQLSVGVFHNGLVNFSEFNFTTSTITTVVTGLGTGSTFAPPWLLTDGTAIYYCVPGGQVARVTTAGVISWTQTAVNCSHGTAFGIYQYASNGVALTYALSIAGCTNGTGVTLLLSDGSVLGTASNFGNSWTSLVDNGAAGVGVVYVGTPSATSGSASKFIITDADDAPGAWDNDPDDQGTLNWSTGGTSLTGTISMIPGGTYTGYLALLDYQRTILLLAVSAGEVKVAWGNAWQATTLGGGISDPPLSATAVVVRSAPNVNKMWFVDGLNWGTRAWLIDYNPATNTCEKWAATVGTIPIDSASNTPRLIATWRGRTVLSGLKLQGNAIFMSAQSDPTNWDYSPASTTPSQAVALTPGNFGQVGDVVTGLCAYSDDILLIFCDHQIWMLRGDPMAGGQLDLVSDQLGGAWGTPWCKDAYGNVYFASGRTGIYKMIPGQQPVRISQSIEPLLAFLSVDVLTIRLGWDDQLQGVHVFCTSIFGAALTNHFFWEYRTGAWWVEQFTNNNHNPLCCHTYYGQTASDRALLIGSWDGYVRAFQLAAQTDDGTTITSSVWLGPLVTKELDAILLKDVQGVLDVASGQVTVSVYVGESAAAAFNSTAVASFTWSAGRNLDSYVRRVGHAVYLKIASTSRWALEAIRLRISTQGKVQRRGSYTSTPTTGGVP